MQSSSHLFPVALISAERRGDLSEDVYRLKPANSPDISVELVVTRLGMADASQVRRVPVILLHGSFSNRRFWYSPKGGGWGHFWPGPALIWCCIAAVAAAKPTP